MKKTGKSNQQIIALINSKYSNHTDLYFINYGTTVINIILNSFEVLEKYNYGEYPLKRTVSFTDIYNFLSISKIEELFIELSKNEDKLSIKELSLLSELDVLRESNPSFFAKVTVSLSIILSKLK